MLLKIIILQAFWFLIVLYGNKCNPILVNSIAFLFTYFNFKYFRPNISQGKYIVTVFVFAIFGIVHDSLLLKFQIINNVHYTFSYVSLWIIFIAYFGDVFNKFDKCSNWILFFVGGLGGAFSYWSAVKMGALVINTNNEFVFVMTTFIFWSIFFPMSIRFFYSSSLWDSLLDFSVIFLFDKSGYVRHQDKFAENLTLLDLVHKSALITGGTSGIGESVAKTLSSLGSNVVITGRNSDKGDLFTKGHANSKFLSLDMSNWHQVLEFCQNSDFFDYVVLNAGSMPEKYSINDVGVESQCASQLVGHFILMNLLKKFGKINTETRIVWVSSGGMYLKKLDLDSLFMNEDYDKVDVYANVKRAQITLTEELANHSEWKNYKIFSMHPGWVSTEGLKVSLPRFYHLLKDRLRDTEQGADTINWLLLTKENLINGAMYFDRKKVSPYITKGFIPSQADRVKLMEILQKYYLNL